MSEYQITTRSALILFFVSAVLFVSLTGCPTPGAGPSTPGTGEISGHARFAGALSSSGILISADSVDGKGKTLAVTRAIKTRSVAGSKSLAGQTTTDASGAYSLTGLGAGTYTVYASSQDSLEKAVKTGVTVVAGKSVSAADLNLTPTGQISGVATLNGASSGNLGIVVFVAGTSFAAMTDDTGAYTISSVPAATGYTLVASMNGYNSMETSVDVNAGATTAAPTMNLTPPVVTPTTGSVTGTAELNGAMSGNTGIFVYLAESPYITMTTSDSGAFSITGVAPGTYTAVASMIGYGTVSVQSVSVTAGNSTNVGIMNLVSAPNGFRFTPSNDYMTAVASGNGVLVAVGNFAMSSSDGVTWVRDLTSPSMTCVLYANGAFYAGDSSGNVYRRDSSSAGSSTWSTLNNGSPVGSSIASVAYGNGNLVAVDRGSTIYYSSDGGASWNPASITSPPAVLYSVTYGASGFVAVGGSGTSYGALTSMDGTSWTPPSLLPTTSVPYLHSVTYGASGYVAVGYYVPSGVITTIVVSSDAQTWKVLSPISYASLASVPGLYSVTYANGLYAAASANADFVLLSADGTSWWAQPFVRGGLDSFLGITGFGTNGQIFVIAHGNAG